MRAIPHIVDVSMLDWIVFYKLGSLHVFPWIIFMLVIPALFGFPY